MRPNLRPANRSTRSDESLAEIQQTRGARTWLSLCYAPRLINAALKLLGIRLVTVLIGRRVQFTLFFRGLFGRLNAVLVHQAVQCRSGHAQHFGGFGDVVVS